MTENTIKTVRVQKIIDECKDIKTLYFNIKEDDNLIKFYPKPGQFVMIWVPGVDEIPMSISECDNEGNWAITVKNIGECTDALYNLNIGDYIGVRGPLGNHFKLPTNNSKTVFLIGGGIGMAPLKFMSIELKNKNIKHTVIEGVKVRDELIFKEVFNELASETFYCTDDGSYGIEGVSSDIFRGILKDFSKKDLSNITVYSCGPEIMLYKLFQLCEENDIEFYASLERIMRCGCGLCGLCALDPLGLLVCKDGPVFDLRTLKKIQDFGKFQRDFTGKKRSLK
ncbi:MAG: dihydroorotate dehydrogenase electron transfer subunit [Candidatus Thorarchaeota archaeon]